MVPHKAAVLLLGVAVVLAGCSSAPAGPPASPTGTGGTATNLSPTTTQTPTATTTGPPTTAATPTRTTTATGTTRATATATPRTTTDDGYYNAFVFEARPVTTGEIARREATAIPELSPGRREIATDALANGTTTVVVDCVPGSVPDRCSPLEDDQFLRANGTYYRVTRTVLDRAERTGYRFDHRAYRRTPEQARRQAVAYESLSPSQRDLFRSLFARAGKVEKVVGDGVYVPPGNASANASGWLDGDPHYVEYEGDVYRLQYDGTTAEQTRLTLRYGLSVAAESASAFVEPRLDGMVVEVTAEAPADPARSVILAALKDGEYEWRGTISTRPRSVEAAERWIREHAPDDGPAVYVRWESDTYHPDTDLYRLAVSEQVE